MEVRNEGLRFREIIEISKYMRKTNKKKQIPVRYINVIFLFSMSFGVLCWVIDFRNQNDNDRYSMLLRKYLRKAYHFKANL